MIRTLFRRFSLAAVTVASLSASPSIAGEAGDLLARHLETGTLAGGETALAPLAAAAPADAEAQFALGAVQFLRALERLGQGFQRHGLSAPNAFGVPLFRMPVPDNPAPEELTYAKLRAILEAFVEQMSLAEATLAKVPDGEAKIVVDLAKVRLDLNADGTAGEDEMLAALLAVADPTGANIGADPSTGMVFAFDRADAIWLRGYSQMLMAFADFLLAHDFSASFEASFHILFPNAGLPMQARSGAASSTFTPDDSMAADAIALLHTIRWPVVEPERMARVRERLLTVVSLSRADWTAILGETDDDREWVPSPRQTTPFPALEVTDEIVRAWLAFLDMGEAILEGRLLLPHWRFAQGFDIKRFFAEPRAFDLVLLIAGQGAVPFLADGPVLRREHGTPLAAFQGRLLGYAVWFN